MKRLRIISFLREQAARCYRAAERIRDAGFADELVRIGRDLEQQADELERGESKTDDTSR